MSVSFGFPSYSIRERRADQAVHLFALVGCLLGIPLLLSTVTNWGSATALVATLLYCVGLLWVWTSSAAYNFAILPGRKEIYRRLDHAGIYMMIAGSYSPFALIKIGGAWGWGIFLSIWLMALIGLFISLRYPRSADRASLALYLVMGWSVLLSIRSLIEAVSTSVLVLLIVGGVLYTAGVGFHLAHRLLYHNAIWHAFVLVATVCHYLAVYLALAAV
ncbi:MAG: hemolysin III family protein [Pseudomonadota bacterium]